MKASPGLNYVTGPMGSGKSLFGIRQIIGAIMKGKYVITNVELKPGWELRTARHNPSVFFSAFFYGITRHRFFGKKYLKMARFYKSLYIFETSLETAMKYRPPGKKEGRAVFVWDEAHNDLNNRDWNSTKAAEGSKAKTVKMRNEITGKMVNTDRTEKDLRALILKWATQLRKLGFVGFLISQHGDNTDAALRRVCNMEIRMRNQRERIRFLGIRFCPIPFFLALYLPANTPRVGKESPYIAIERYFLSWHKKCYDTLGLFHNIQQHIEGEDAIWLPPPGEYHEEVRQAGAAETLPVAPAESAETLVAAKPPERVREILHPSGGKIEKSPRRGSNRRPDAVRLVSPSTQPEGGQ